MQCIAPEVFATMFIGRDGVRAVRLIISGLPTPHFSRPVRNAHRVPTFVGVSRERFRPGKPHPKRLATGDLLTNRRICEKVRFEFHAASQFSSLRPGTFLNSRTFPVTKTPCSAATIAATR